MQTVNQTEIVPTTEEKAEMEMDEVRAEQSERVVERKDRKSVIPLAFVTFLASKPAVYQTQERRGDLSNPTKAARHPDVIQLCKDIRGLSVPQATRIAWLLWRARQVEFWTMDLRTDRLVPDSDGHLTVRRGTPTHTWEECLDAAYLGKSSAIHELAMERRERFYAEQEKERDALESIALTLPQVGGDRPVQVEPAIAQAAAQADAKLVEKEEAAQAEARKIEAVKPTVRKPTKL